MNVVKKFVQELGPAGQLEVEWEETTVRGRLVAILVANVCGQAFFTDYERM